MMIARRFEDLVVWQLSVALRRLIYRFTRAGPAAKDLQFRNQVRDSAASAPRNISEGFKRFDPPEFANFLKIALASLAETQNHLLHGREEEYFTDDEFTEAWRLTCRALKAGNRLHEYLRRCPRKGPGPTPARAEPKNPAQPNRGEPKNREEPKNRAEPKNRTEQNPRTEPSSTQ